jgi:predicted O-linked N-acetylglucosamine transferase (SPINDLY family)
MDKIIVEANFEKAKNFFLLGLEKLEKDLNHEAEHFFSLSLELIPERLSTLINLSTVLLKLNKVEKAEEILNKAINLYPTNSSLYLNQGQLFEKKKNLKLALASYSKATECNVESSEAHYNRAVILQKLKRLNETLASFQRAFELNPDYEFLFGSLLHTKMHLCDWQDFDSNVEDLITKIREGKRSSPSFPVLALVDSLEIHRKVSDVWINDGYKFNTSLGSIPKYLRQKKIRIGYYSADFHNHATAYLMAELFELHDKSKFEIIAFSFGPELKDEMRQRLILAFDHFIDIRNKSDKDVAIMSREMGVDIAIDLKGHTQDQRVGIFSYRAAPIQVNYLGYPGTTAAEYFDYIIADTILIPVESQKYYCEKVVYLPNSYQANDRKRVISEKLFTRQDLDLPKDGVVFCCFNNNFKLTPRTFDCWMRILKAVNGSVLWLLEDNATAVTNLQKEAVARGLDPNRLIFAKRMKLPDHLARHKLADLFLDTLPYNAHTTASDALWAGLPVLSCMGESFASRVAASLLNAIELPELIVSSQEQYEAMAVELATNPVKLGAIKARLERNRPITALFDTLRFTKNIEEAYTQMYERFQNDFTLNHIYIQD